MAIPSTFVRNVKNESCRRNAPGRHPLRGIPPAPIRHQSIPTPRATEGTGEKMPHEWWAVFRSLIISRWHQLRPQMARTSQDLSHLVVNLILGAELAHRIGQQECADICHSWRRRDSFRLVKPDSAAMELQGARRHQGGANHFHQAFRCARDGQEGELGKRARGARSMGPPPMTRGGSSSARPEAVLTWARRILDLKAQGNAMTGLGRPGLNGDH